MNLDEPGQQSQGRHPQKCELTTLQASQLPHRTAGYLPGSVHPAKRLVEMDQGSGNSGRMIKMLADVGNYQSTHNGKVMQSGNDRPSSPKCARHFA